MTFTTESVFNNFANSFGVSINADAVTATTQLIKNLSIDDQLGVFWFIYTEMGRSITPAAPGAARLQLAEGLLDQIKKMSHPEQLNVMRDLASKANTPISRSYGILSANTKLAFWYQLAEWMKQGFVVPVPPGYQLNRDAQRVLEAIQKLDFGQQISVLRSFVVDMGVDPLAD